MTIQLTDRYLSHCEDEPIALTNRYRTLEEATAVTIRRVETRLERNGCGHGLVYDRLEGRIVAVYSNILTGYADGDPDFVVGFKPLPIGASEARMKTLAIAWDESTVTGDCPEFIWQTNSDF